ncbi:hypothetical protein PF004_g33012 [Phytophthora fragariae]|uniref:Uncharacterized protein n=1 Tax=Phytophthora fragariae TaxID=53985 RepID=A0A6A3FBP6_9STRA|nr:hypothetical protein PF003_g14748 [Phytophthora fragariae]KAE8901321.1 hypothetical protein PF003_g14756 [Phytophthora fragariae]KAE8901438.1 hypothetical protein PF003_g14768 [Phytophthora fragariae]KAE8901480.1 hypothetical protein PF003_g14744 [Phytophthora fragariae]KAE8901482.1 hypothetical protein PF003_g14746 [Phytophthora fragariae]
MKMQQRVVMTWRVRGEGGAFCVVVVVLVAKCVCCFVVLVYSLSSVCPSGLRG